MDLITEDKVIQGKDYTIKGFADKASGNITFKILTRNQDILKAFRTKDFANAVSKVYRGGVDIDTYSFKPTYSLFSIKSYDTSQSSMWKLMNIIKDKI
jgi:cytochrome b involved in lipid metabolism